MLSRNRRLVEFALRNSVARRVVDLIGTRRAEKLVQQLGPWLSREGRVLDVGIGSGHLAKAIRGNGQVVIGCDLTDMRFQPLPLVIADGQFLPFADGSFGTTLMLTVLHHVPKERHSEMLREAYRVLRPKGRLLLLEDTYHTRAERVVTQVLDSAMNAEFFGHPHSNRTLDDWMRLLAELGLKVVHAGEFIEWYGVAKIRHGLIVVEKGDPQA